MGRAGALIACALLASASLTLERGQATPAAVRIIDRTFVCEVEGLGFPDVARTIYVGAGRNDPEFKRIPQITVLQRGFGEGALGAFVRTGPGQGWWRTGHVTLPRIPADRCADSGALVRLTSEGLRGGSVGNFVGYDCDVPAKVLLRVRAIFKRPTFFRAGDPRYPWRVSAGGNIRVGFVALTTLGRKPLAFASVRDAGGKASVFAARSCIRDA